MATVVLLRKQMIKTKLAKGTIRTYRRKSLPAVEIIRVESSLKGCCLDSIDRELIEGHIHSSVGGPNSSTRCRASRLTIQLKIRPPSKQNDTLMIETKKITYLDTKSIVDVVFKWAKFEFFGTLFIERVIQMHFASVRY